MSRPTVTNCPTCTSEGERGSCARLRCYCAHAECWAFDSYQKPEPVAVAIVRAPDARMARSWAEREEPTWLDR